MRNQQSYDAFKLSPRYCLSPANRVQRLKKPLEQLHSDVAATFKRLYKGSKK